MIFKACYVKCILRLIGEIFINKIKIEYNKKLRFMKIIGYKAYKIDNIIYRGY